MSPLLDTNDVNIFYDVHGDSADKLLMIVGRNGQVTDWHADLIGELVERKFEVICFDNRDAGLSTHFEDAGAPNLLDVWKGKQVPPYSLADMARDAAGLMKVLCPDGAIVVGMSLGSMIAQRLVIDFPDIVRGLVLISGSTGAAGVGMPAEEIMQSMLSGAKSPASDESPVERGFKSSSRWTSWELGATEEQLRQRISARVERRVDESGTVRQMAAVLASSDRTEELGSIKVPTWVLHGAEDPLVDVSGGTATAAAIPDAQLQIIEKLRHDLPRAIWPDLIQMIEDVRSRHSPA